MFRKCAVILAVAVSCSLISGCMSVKMAAAGDDVAVMTAAKPASFKTQQKNWFVLWGLVPLNEHNVRSTIESNGLSEVRLETKQTFIDWLISGVLGFVSVTCNTSVIEGNAK